MGTLRSYLKEEEVLARKGTLKRAFARGDVFLVGHADRQQPMTWLEEAFFKRAVASYNWSR